jgi:hypothetical protein
MQELRTLDGLVRFQQTLVEMAFDFADSEEPLEFDHLVLYNALRRIMDRHVVNVVSSLSQFEVPGINKVDLDIFSTDTVVLMGEPYSELKHRIVQKLYDSPFTGVMEIPAQYEDDRVSLSLDLKVDSPHLKSVSVSIQPIAYFDPTQYNFCSSYLCFEPHTEIFLDGNIAKKNYVQG